MANTVSARKRARQNEQRRLANNSARSQFRTYVKRVLLAIHKGDKQGATDAFRTAVPVIDRMAHKGIIHRNKAARHKSRLNARIRAMA